MKTFPSMTEFINYYNEKQTIPSSIALTINGAVHEFKRTSHHNNYKITRSREDNYTFVENENCGLQIELNVNYYRYYEAKTIVEAYLLFFHNEHTLYLHPIYFYNKFIAETDFEPYIDATSSSLAKWTGLKWINTDIAPKAFVDIRAEAYRNIQNDLFYLLPLLVGDHDDLELDSHVLDTLNEARKKKWLMDESDHSSYFERPFKMPECW